MRCLNQELLDAGLAELWRTPDPLDLATMNQGKLAEG
jgi:hypothetical protein